MGNRKRLSSVIIIISVVLLSVLLAACSSPATTTTTPSSTTPVSTTQVTTTPTTTSATVTGTTTSTPAATVALTAAPWTQTKWTGAAVQNPINLTFATSTPATAILFTRGIFGFTTDVTNDTNGEVQWTWYLGGTLLKAPDCYDGVISKITDVTYGAFNSTPGRFPLTEVFSLPFMAPDGYTAMRVLNDLYNQYPQIQQEWSKIHLLYFHNATPSQIHTAKKPVQTLEDLKGMRVAGSAVPVTVIEALGATPVSMTSKDFYLSLQKGIIDGVIVPYTVMDTFGLRDVTKYHTNADISTDGGFVGMNIDTWNSLPPNIQQTMTDVAAYGPQRQVDGSTYGDQTTIDEINAQDGTEIINLSPEERQRWIDKATNYWDSWAEDLDGQGLPGTDVLNSTIDLVKKYEANPLTGQFKGY